MVGGDGSRTLECLTTRILTRRSLEYDVTARDIANVEPPIIGLSHREAQIIVVRISATDEHRPVAGQCVFDQSEAAITLRWLCVRHGKSSS